MRRIAFYLFILFLGMLCRGNPAWCNCENEDSCFQENIVPVGYLKPVDSQTSLKVGDQAPDFDLPAIDGKRVRLSDFRDKNNVVLSFVPAAWTPVCSSQ